MAEINLLQANNYIGIIDYVKTKMETYAESPFNEVDSLIYAQFSYMFFENLVPTIDEGKDWVYVSSLYRAEKFDVIVSKSPFPESNKELLTALCASPRYRDVLMNYYTDIFDKDTAQQFSAVTFKLPTGELVVAFRGTDSSMVGWKEDFNMAYLAPVPSQISAQKYLDTVADNTNAVIYTTGHSKGGNLSVYSATHAKKETQDRIIAVYDHDGPGFAITPETEKVFNTIKGKVNKYTPEGSIVGVVLQSISDSNVIKSNKLGVMQHDTFTWQIENDSFVPSDSMTSGAKYFDKTTTMIMKNLDAEQKKLMVDTVFSIIDAANVETIYDLGPVLIKEKDNIFNAIKSVDDETANCIKEIMKRFVKISFTSAFDKADDIKKSIAIFN